MLVDGRYDSVGVGVYSAMHIDVRCGNVVLFQL